MKLFATDIKNNPDIAKTARGNHHVGNGSIETITQNLGKLAMSEYLLFKARFYETVHEHLLKEQVERPHDYPPG